MTVRTRLRRSRTALLAAVLGLTATAAPAAAVPFRVESDVEPRVAGPGQRFRFTIEVQGPGYAQPRLRPRFELDNLRVVAGPDSRHGISVGGPGGESGWHYSWTWWLEGTAPGPASVRDVHLLVGDREVDLPSRHVEVVRQAMPGLPGGSEPPPRSALEELLRRTRERLRHGGGSGQDRPPEVFLQAVATPARPYVGQRVVYTVYLLAREGVRGIELESQPAYRGMWARAVKLEPSADFVEWQGEVYRRSPIFCKELFALAARAHHLEPVRARVVVDRIEDHRMFSAPVRVPVEVVAESNPVEIDVRSLPPAEATSAGFSGLVGRLSLGAVLAPASVAVDQGATLTLTAAGEGHLEALPAPPFEPPPGLELIGPQPVPTPEDGSRSWQYLLVPRRPGAFRLPAVELSYFDPEAGEYRLARALPPALTARPATAEDAAVTAPPRPIRSAALPAPPEPLWRSGLPWAFALPWAAAVVLILVRRGGGGSSGVAGAAAGLPRFREQLRTALAEERPRRAAADIERAWRELLAGCLGVPEAVPAASWPDELLERGAARETRHQLRGLLADLHYLRFAPELSATAALAGDLVRRSERLARDLLRR